MKRALAAGAALSLLPILATAAPAAAASEPLEDLQLGSLKNLDVGRAGRLVYGTNLGDRFVVQSVTTVGPQRVSTIAEFGPGDGGAAQNARGETWVIYSTPPENEGDPPSTDPNVFYVSPRGEVTPVLSTVVYQEGDPDPYDLEDIPAETNPYDVEVLRDGSALIADAAGNDLIRVWKDGTAETVACFPTEVVSTEDVPPPVLEETGPLPPFLPTESVPTGVSVGTDRMAYVSELKGFPFQNGSSKIWKVDPDVYGQGCDGSVGAEVAPGEVAASGFSGINDVHVAQDRSIYVTELNRNGVWAAEQAFADPSSQIGQGRLTMIDRRGGQTELAQGELTFPGSAVVGLRGEVFVADSWLFGASILRIT